MLDENLIMVMKDYADRYNVPIMMDEGIEYLRRYISAHNVKNILEIGTAIGYSSIMMAAVREDITVTTIERDNTRYLEAVRNVKKANMSNRINLIYNDALEVELSEKYDLIFIDAAKAQSKKFFLKFSNNLNDGGVIVTDNLNFHGLVQESEEIQSRNLRQLVRKIKDYVEFLKENSEYETEFLEIGDGISVSRKK